MEIELRTLTPVWTGGVDQSCDRIHETSLIGGLRWWYEALVRGLGGCACDPTSKKDRCPDERGKRCAACELFGCTGWARKFRLRLLDGQSRVVQEPLGHDMDFKLQFLELRALRSEEKWLLAKAIKIAAEYGALGGKTTLKPQKKSKVGDDYGIVSLVKDISVTGTRQSIEDYLKDKQWRQVQTKLPDLRWFFFVTGGFLWRREMNSLMGRSPNGKRIVRRGQVENALRGDVSDSKKIFSFRIGGGRIWGYAPDVGTRDEIIKQISRKLDRVKVKTGEEVLDEL